ncbi:MAG: ribonuclease R [Bacteroidaceae bacterium]|nr:ribonuclease R [Bacteroidaceae bacterium]
MTRSKLNKKQLKEKVIDFLSSRPRETFTLKQLFSSLRLTAHPLKILCVDVLNELLDEDQIFRNYDGEIAFNGQTKQVAEGVFRCMGRRRNLVETTDGLSVFINDDDTLHALNGDKVKVTIFATRKKSDRLNGEIIEVLERSNKPIVGVLQVSHGVAFLVHPDGSLPYDVFIPENQLKGGKNGDKASVQIVDWPENTRNPIGVVKEIFGKEGENETEMHAILAEYGLPYSYPKDVERYADKISDVIPAEEVAKREDFRNVTTFTIDPRDAKDFDDALSIRPLEKGHYEVGVHIADVSHYVLEGSIIDKEAQQRGTSVYLVDRTIPMLPERLCNYICSLRPDEDKLAFSVIFDMDEDAKVYSSRIVHTIIRSNRRFVYEEVQEILEQNGEADDIEGHIPVAANKRTGEYCNELITLNRMAHKLKANRMYTGAIDFDREEIRFEIDEKGKPISVYFKVAKDANKLVEEFMLLANRTVAESVGKVKKGQKAKVLPYRVHDLPDPGKLDNLAQFVKRFKYNIITQGSKTEVAKSINKLLMDVRGDKIQNLVENVSLRAMMKAKYSTHNIGHYGLAFDYYTHFTSPIRRYPDLMVHRLLTRYAEGGASASQKKYEGLCEHSSAMEQLATAAERASIKYKQVEYMSERLGEEYDARISGVTEAGIYAEINENHCEGFIAVRFLAADETFDFDDKNYCLIGRKSHHRFSIGDEIRIKVAKANLFRKTLDFDFIKKYAK